jgi:RNA 3'-terminal phosphate cyclase (ATP)
MSAQASAQITDGKIETAGLDAKELIFYPGRLRGGRYTFDVASLTASAGSTGLIFQTVVPPLCFADKPSHLTIKGGTHVEWSPAADYIKEVFLQTVKAMGVRVAVDSPLKGFYPVGGGELTVDINPSVTPLKPLNITGRGRLARLTVLSAVANLPLSIAQRQLDRAVTRLSAFGLEQEGKVAEFRSPGKGTFLFVLVEFENIRAGFTALGAIGKRAEKVADEAVSNFYQYWKRGGALEPHLADQVVLNMALAEGHSSVTTSEITQHLMTNIWVIEHFFPLRFTVKGSPGEEGRVAVKGVGFKTSHIKRYAVK